MALSSKDKYSFRKTDTSREEKSMFIPVAEPVIGEREITYVTDAVRSGWVSSLGVYVDEFERKFSEYIGVAHGIAVSNGTVGLHLALHALGIGPGDEVLLPSLTFVATAHSVLQTGATPVFVDIEPDTWCIDPIALEKGITPKTKAIIPVHLYGHPADMDAIQNMARKHNLLVIEDAAEAHGAEINGRKVGSFGQAGVFSFYGNKIITTGEGGIITTDDPVLAKRLRYLKDHGMSLEHHYYHTELAFNYRMTNLQAALGVAQLEQIEKFINKKREIFSWYLKGMRNLPGIKFNAERPGIRNVYWLTCMVLTEQFPLSRSDLAIALHEHGIDTRPFFVPMHKLPHLSKFRTISAYITSNGCPHAEEIGSNGINLPSGCNLEKVTVDRIIDTLNKIVSSAIYPSQ